MRFRTKSEGMKWCPFLIFCFGMEIYFFFSPLTTAPGPKATSLSVPPGLTDNRNDFTVRCENIIPKEK